MDSNKFFQSKFFRVVLIGIGALIVLLSVFKLGMIVGFKKAGFTSRWSENYHRNFAGPKGGFFMDFSERDFIKPHGTFGRIIKIELPVIAVAGENDAEKIVVLKNDTIIKRFREIISQNDLKIDDNIVVIGSPNEQGQIEAKLIRIMPKTGAFIRTHLF